MKTELYKQDKKDAPVLYKKINVESILRINDTYCENGILYTVMAVYVLDEKQVVIIKELAMANLTDEFKGFLKQL